MFLTLAAAKQIAAAAEQEAANNQWNVVITIVDDGGNLFFMQRMDNSQLGSIDVSLQKARAAVYFKRPTKALEDAVTAGRTVMMGLKNMAAIEGGVPLIAGGQVIGAIGVSGVTAAQDGQIANAGAAALERILSA